jgi:hypothetical protein
MNVNDAFPNKYLKASDLHDKDVTVTIKSAGLEEVGFDQEKKLVLSFAGTEKLFVANKTNAYAIARLHGQEIAGWGGKRITLCTKQVEYQGRLTDAVRVVEQKPAAAAAQKAAAPPPPPPAQTQEIEVEDQDGIPF